MNRNTSSDGVDVYEENVELTAMIENILSMKISLPKKITMLRQFRQTACFPMGQAHVQYYIDRLTQWRYRRISRNICATVFLVYLFLICSSVVDYYIPAMPFPVFHYSSMTLTNIVISFLFLSPAVMLAYYILKYHIDKKK